jgi:hypothetical protein
MTVGHEDHYDVLPGVPRIVARCVAICTALLLTGGFILWHWWPPH